MHNRDVRALLEHTSFTNHHERVDLLNYVRVVGTIGLRSSPSRTDCRSSRDAANFIVVHRASGSRSGGRTQRMVEIRHV